jgi:hypothetical protein
MGRVSLGKTPGRHPSTPTIAWDTGEWSAWARSAGDRVLDCGLVHVTGDVTIVGVVPCQTRGEVWIERPIFQQGGRNEVDPNDLIMLGVKVGRIAEPYLALDNEVTLIRSTDWKGGTRKDIQENRTRASLDPVELAMVTARADAVAKSYRHNIWDAVGILIWRLKREGLRS